MWNTGSTYNLSSGMAVAGERAPRAGGRQGRFLVTPASTPGTAGGCGPSCPAQDAAPQP